MSKPSIGIKAAALSLAALVTAGSLPVMTVSAAERTYKEQELTAYMFSMNNPETIKCLFYDDMPSMPYISIMDYLGKIYDNRFTLADNGGGVYTVTSSTEKTMVIDTEKDTIHFDEFENFLPRETTDADNDGPEAPYIKNHTLKLDDSKKALDLDYGKYQIDLTSVNGSVYFPLTTASDLFAEVYLGAEYLDGKIYFIQTMEKRYYDNASAYSMTPRSKDAIEYTYKELCFVMDHFFGKPPKSQLAEQLETKNFDELMSTGEHGAAIKPLLMSENVMDFYTGLVLLDSFLDDGGHSGLSSEFTSTLLEDQQNEFATAAEKLMHDNDNSNAFAIAANFAYLDKKNELNKTLSDLRSKQYTGYELVKTWENEETDQFIGQLVMNGDTAVFLFNDFIDPVVPAFKWSLDYAEEKGAKNFVLDLTMNTGGSNAVMMYMLSIMTGKNTITTLNTLTGNKTYESGDIDRNLDGVVDEKDAALNYNLRFAILTSCQSFSCANYLPCLAQEQQIPIVGETSGGGTCYLTQMTFPGKVMYALSGFKTMLNERGENVDAGAEVNYATVTKDAEGNTDYAKLYDISAVSKYLDEYYAKVTPTKAAIETPAKEGDKNTSPVATILMIAIPAAAVLVVIAVVVIVLLKKRRSRPVPPSE